MLSGVEAGKKSEELILYPVSIRFILSEVEVHNGTIFAATQEPKLFVVAVITLTSVAFDSAQADTHDHGAHLVESKQAKNLKSCFFGPKNKQAKEGYEPRHARHVRASEEGKFFGTEIKT